MNILSLIVWLISIMILEADHNFHVLNMILQIKATMYNLSLH